MEELRDHYFVKKGSIIRRLRQIWVKKYGFWFLKDVPIEMMKDQVKKLEKPILNQQDIHDHLAENSSKIFDMNKPLWEVQVKEDYDENTSVVFIVYHHIIGDGMSMMNLVTLMNDSHNPKDILISRSIPFLHRYIIPFFYIPLGVYRITCDALNVKNDLNMKPLQLKGDVQSTKKKFYSSKYYELDKLRGCYSKFQDTKLNSYMFAMISKSMSKYFEELHIPQEKQTHFSVTVSINMKPPADSLEKITFKNTNSLALVNVPLTQNLGKCLSKIRDQLKNSMSFHNLSFRIWVVSFLGSCPDYIYRILGYDNNKGLDIILSNTPGPTTPIHF